MINVMLMAGKGERFLKSKLLTPKPLIEINQKLMYELVLSSFPKSDKDYLVISSSIEENIKYKESVEKNKKISSITVKTPNKGQAHSLFLFLEKVNINDSFFVGPCDTILKLNNFSEENYDFIFLTSIPTKYQIDNTEQFGFYDEENKKFISKEKIKVTNHKVLLGGFYFKNKNIFIECYKKMVNNNDKANGEFYLDKIGNYIDNELKIKNLIVNSALSLGTPEELKKNLHKI